MQSLSGAGVMALAYLLLTGPAASAQQRRPVLRATQPRLSIREGRSLYKDVWGVSSAARPDVFVAQPFTGRQRIVFYSDQDSVAFWVKPRHTYDFVVLVGGQDSAYTRISTHGGQPPTLVPKLAATRRPGTTGPDTLRFQLDQHFGIHVQGQLNGSAPLNWLVDTGAGAVVVASAVVASQRVALKQDGQTINAGADGRRSVRTSSGNTLEIGGLRWRDVSLLTIDYASPAFDGVLGWVAFENRVVEIDYERRLLVVHDHLPALGPDYSPVDLQLRSGIPFLKCTLTANGQPSEGWFDLDTGSDGGLVVSQRFAARHNLAAGLQRQGTAQLSGSTGGVVRQTIFTLPKLKIGDYELYQLPLYVNDQDPAGGAAAENIGSNLLKRFNLVLDFQANRAYLKPNRYLYAPVADEAGK